MRKKLVGIVIFMLMATTVVSATHITVKENENTSVNTHPVPLSLFDWWSVDQKQTHTDGYGVQLIPPWMAAQSFTPTKPKLTAVSLYLFKHDTPPEPVLITVTIRDNLTGADLSTKTIDTSEVTIASTATWVVFDFDDISITPGSKYYIVCSGSAGAGTNAYCWLYSVNDTYLQGEVWEKPNVNISWRILHGVGDFCFKTHFRKPLDTSIPVNNENLVNPWLLSMFERFPHAFPILRHLMGY